MLWNLSSLSERHLQYHIHHSEEINRPFQIAIYVYYVVQLKSGIELYGPVPQRSLLIFNPYKTSEMWRYFTYMFIHIG